MASLTWRSKMTAYASNDPQNRSRLIYFPLNDSFFVRKCVQDASSNFCQAVNRNPATGAITVPYSLDVLQANIGGLET